MASSVRQFCRFHNTRTCGESFINTTDIWAARRPLVTGDGQACIELGQYVDIIGRVFMDRLRVQSAFWTQVQILETGAEEQGYGGQNGESPDGTFLIISILG